MCNVCRETSAGNCLYKSKINKINVGIKPNVERNHQHKKIQSFVTQEAIKLIICTLIGCGPVDCYLN